MTALRPLLVGVAGGSGSGKTTVARSLVTPLGERAVLLDMDAYYRDLAHLPFEQRTEVNFDHPDAFDIDLLAAHLETLLAGRPIEKPTYDYARHTRADATVRVEPREVVVMEGILLFLDRRLRELFDVRVFVDVADDVRFIRRLTRDVAERGRSLESVIGQYLTSVRPMHLEFVEPSKRHADVIIPEGGENRIGVELIRSQIERELARRAAAG
jgi:uridine kinase